MKLKMNYMKLQCRKKKQTEQKKVRWKKNTFNSVNTL